MKVKWTYLIYLTFLLFSSCNSDLKNNEELVYKVNKSDFTITINSLGELQAEKYDRIQAPEGLREINIYNIKITDLVSEGTKVEKGDYVGRLDKSSIETKHLETAAELEKLQDNYIQAKIDSSITLSDLREEIIDLNSSFKEKQIEFEQSQYEPPATIRKFKLELNKLERSLKQNQKNYELKIEQSNSTVKNAYLRFKHYQTLMNKTKMIREQFTIVAPSDGIIIYKKERDKSKRQVGSTINPWDPVIALLPDLSEMVCITHINELDISKISIGQNAKVIVDAFPDKLFNGKVVEIANIGESMNSSSVKTFEVVVKLTEADSLIKPAMTTTCSILTNSYKNVLSVPIIGIQIEDSLKYVYLKKDKEIIKQEVITGEANEDYIIIKKGLKENDEILLAIPENSEKLHTKFIES
jgi:HlyD family secretion protein